MFVHVIKEKPLNLPHKPTFRTITEKAYQRLKLRHNEVVIVIGFPATEEEQKKFIDREIKPLAISSGLRIIADPEIDIAKLPVLDHLGNCYKSPNHFLGEQK